MHARRHIIALVLGVLGVCAAGCDPLSYLDQVPRIVRPAPPGPPAPLPVVDELITARRADLLMLLVAGRTQAVHLAGVCAPSPVPGKLNTQLAAHTGLAPATLPAHGKSALDTVRAVLATGTWRLAVLGQTTNNGSVRAAVDLLNERDESLTAMLLSRGLVARAGAAPHTVLPYERLELEARMAERGMWSHPVPLERRLRLRSTFARETLSRDRRNVYQQRTSTTGAASSDNHAVVLERHENVEQRGVITLEVQAQPPVTRPYELVTRYRFIITDDHGRNQQSITTLTDDGKRVVSQRSPRGERVSDAQTTAYTIVPLTVTSPLASVEFTSDAVSYTRSSKVGVDYQQGQSVDGYELEVLLGTNVVYTARETR